MQDTDAYRNSIRNALINFQMIEEALKIYIGLSHEIVKTLASHQIPYNFDPSHINKQSIGSLIKMFSNFSNNSDLVSDMNRIVSWRNFCAHRAFTHEFLSRQKGTPVASRDIDDVKTVSDFSLSLIDRIEKELKAIREVHGRILSATAPISSA